MLSFMMPGAPGKETKKLAAFCVLLLVVVGAFWLSRRKSGTEPGASQVRPGQPVDVEDAEDPLPLGSMRVQAVPDENTGNEAAAPDETGIPAPAGEITDGEGTIEEEYLFDLLKTAKRVPAADLKSRAREVLFGDVFDNPEDWRGKVIRVEGRVRRLVRRRNEALPEGIETIYEAQVMAPSGYWYWVFVVEKPRFGTGALVVFDGIFMKIHAYENRKGTTTLAPLFVCKNFEKLEIKQSPFFGAVGWATLAVVVAGLILAIVVSRGQRRASEAIARAVEDKRLDKARRWAQSRKEEDTKGKS